MVPSRFVTAAVGAFSLAAAPGCHRSLPPADTGFVTTWTASAYGLARAERLNPPVASRMFAYAAIALYEGWAAFSDSLRTLAGQLNGLDHLPSPAKGKRYDPALVAVEAQTTVLEALYRGGFPTTQAAIGILHDSLVAARRSQGVGELIIRNSRSYGEELGQAILAWAAQDHFLETRGKPFTMPVGPQYWVPTATEAQYRSQNLSPEQEMVELNNPTATANPGAASERSLILNRPKHLGMTFTPGVDPTKPVEPYWGELRTFAIPDANACQAPPPVPFSTKKGSPFYQQAWQVYEVGKTLTEEQHQIAEFWADNPGESGTPAGHWIGIISRFANQHHLSPERAVEAFALAAIAGADSFIGCWHLKYQVNLVRPYTYIVRYIDPKWQTAIITPPFPEYASGHTIQSAATAEVLSGLFGENTPFEDATHVALGHPIKHFPSFRAAAQEVIMARLWGGCTTPCQTRTEQPRGAAWGRRSYGGFTRGGRPDARWAASDLAAG